MLELLLADESIPKLEELEDRDELDTLDKEVLLEPPPPEPPPPHPTIIPPEMVKHKYRPIFDRII